jgi:predicted protein tyrosine phosphatase
MNKRILFVCTIGEMRSATASLLASQRGINSRCYGTDPNALIVISERLIKWATQIIFVNSKNYRKAKSLFTDPVILELIEQKRYCWEIPDEYEFNDPELVQIINIKLDFL